LLKNQIIDKNKGKKHLFKWKEKALSAKYSLKKREKIKLAEQRFQIYYERDCDKHIPTVGAMLCESFYDWVCAVCRFKEISSLTNLG